MAYSPAGNLTSTSGTNHIGISHYDRVALMPIRKYFHFWKGVDDRVLPKKTGKTIQFYRYSQLGANTSATTEGTVGSPVTALQSAVVTATVAQYADFVSLSDMLVDVALDPDIVATAADQLGYRAALTTNTIVKNEVDSNSGSVTVSLLGDYLTGSDLANIRHRFAGLDIKPKDGDSFPTLVHPYVSYDLIHDPAIGGFMDLAKRGVAGFDSTVGGVADRGYLFRFNNCEVWEDTNCTVTAGTPNLYRCYFFGQEGLGAIDLAGRGPSRTEDQDRTKFKVMVQSNIGQSVANPEAKIRAVAAYNFVFVAKTLDSTNFRYRIIDAPTSLGL